jgi:hypothetical protein
MFDLTIFLVVHFWDHLIPGEHRWKPTFRVLQESLCKPHYLLHDSGSVYYLVLSILQKSVWIYRHNSDFWLLCIFGELLNNYTGESKGIGMEDQFAQITRTRQNCKICATFSPGMMNMLPNNSIEKKFYNSLFL